jgi:hypothetical protein
MFHQ